VTGAYPVLHVGSFRSARSSGSAGPSRFAGPSGSAGPVRPACPWTRTFRGTPASVPEARRFVAELLAGCPAREVLMLCVSELSTNAIEHSDSGNGGVFIVEVDLPRPGVARIAVTDEGGPSLPTPASLTQRRDPALPPGLALPPNPGLLPDPGLLSEGGRGLAMVAACTSRWGYADAHPGRTVWAEACWPVPVPSPPDSTPRNTSRRRRPAPGPDASRLPRPAPSPDAPRRPRPRFSPGPPTDCPPDPAA
jgi:serine/threonine-protein kinase RsbW